MNKKVLLLGMTSILAVGTVAAVALTTNGNLLNQGLKADDNYSITIEPEDIVATHQDEWKSGNALLKTDQLHNDITFAYINANHNGEGDGLYLEKNGSGEIHNAIGNEVRSIESILIKGANDPFTVKWGFKNSGGDDIEYVDNEWAYATPAGYEFTLNGDEPNYFKIESGSGSTGADCLLYQIVITYSSACVEHANPYRVVNGIKYHRAGSEWSVMGFDGASSANVVIEETIDGLPVTDILAYAFSRDTTITSISLPKTIKQIADSFDGCTNLSSVTFATGGTADLKIYGAAFRDTAISTITLPKRLDYIGGYAFMNTPNLESIAIEDDYSGGNYEVRDGALYKVSASEVALIHYPENSPYPIFNVPGDITKINEYSCQNTINLRRILFNNSDDLFIDAYAFGNDNDDSSITDIYFQGAGQVTIYWHSFRGYKHDLVLPLDVIIDAEGLAQMADGARVFFTSAEVKDNWSSTWADGKGDAKFYLFSSEEPAGAAPTNIDGFWHYVDDVPTLWS